MTKKGGSLTKTFADDPAAWFEYDSHRAHHLPRAEAEGLQLEALRERFGVLRGKLPALAALADAQKIDTVASLAAAAPLLYPHGFFKSYPEQLLVEGAFATLTEWLSRLNISDLSAVRGRNFVAIDDWLDALDNETALEMYHSSGTTGRLSYYPRGKAEGVVQLAHASMAIAEWFDPPKIRHGEHFFTLVWPSHAFGRTAILRGAKLFRQMLTENEDDYQPLLPSVMSADLHYHILRTRNMMDQGHAFAPVASEYVHARMAEAEALKAYVPERTQQLLDIMADRKRSGKRVMIAGGPVNIHNLAKAGLDRGLESLLLPGSLVRAFGGLKNHPDIPTLEADVARFTGEPNYLNAFGMTELTSTFSLCRAGRFHIPPWVVPYVFDTENGALLACIGRQRGRSGFFDLAAQSYWGGVITADAVEIGWDDCTCGRTTPHMAPAISRIAETPGGDCYIGPAPTAAVDAALEALLKGLPRPN